MEIHILDQALILTLSLFMGAGLGILYDMLRPPRRKMKKISGAILDALYCFFAGFVIFCFAMGADKGRLGTWELFAALAGFLVYMHTLSRYFLCFFSKALNRACMVAENAKKIIKKISNLLKLYFQKLRE